MIRYDSTQVLGLLNYFLFWFYCNHNVCTVTHIKDYQNNQFEIHKLLQVEDAAYSSSLFDEEDEVEQLEEELLVSLSNGTSSSFEPTSVSTTFLTK